MGDIVDLNTLLELANLKNKVIDYFKMDIEGPEKNVIEGLDMSYACKYIKQLALEAHKNFRFADIEKLEQCFMLFKRDTRFFDQLIFDERLGYLTEFQAPKGFDLKLQNYFNETYLAEVMFVSGELYFINRNFLSSDLI
jgi:hypothetical protein